MKPPLDVRGLTVELPTEQGWCVRWTTCRCA